MKDRIDSFDVSLYKSALHDLEFAVIYPNSIANETDNNVIEKRNLFVESRIKQFIDFHIAIRPRVATVLFSISEHANVGSPVFNLADKENKLYNIPKSMYPYLEEIVVESPFVVSNTLLTHVIENKQIHKSVFTSLPDYYQENGLVVLGTLVNAT